jgi:hypothetical protein
MSPAATSDLNLILKLNDRYYGASMTLTECSVQSHQSPLFETGLSQCKAQLRFPFLRKFRMRQGILYLHYSTHGGSIFGKLLLPGAIFRSLSRHPFLVRTESSYPLNIVKILPAFDSHVSQDGLELNCTNHFLM